jgi:hypothetical protein
MALNVTKLMVGARAHASKNRTLGTVYQLCQQYNALPPTAGNKARIDLIHLIARMAGDYLTSKPPQGSYKNTLRWEGLTDVLEQLGAESKAAGVRMITGPTDYRKIDDSHRSYWLELLDPMHRAGFSLSPKYSTWLTDTTAIQTKKSFWAYIGTKASGSDSSTDVAYLNEGQGPKQYQVEFDASGLLVESIGDQPYSTRLHETAFSGDGWAIFVVSPTGELYSASHIVGKLHHSSFLGGRPVMAAGELVSEDGVVKVLTAKSGHYRPSPDDLLRMVRQFPMIPSDAVIRPDLQDEKHLKYVAFYRVGDFRAKGLNAKPVSQQDALASLPAWARAPKAMDQFDDIPKAGREAATAGIGPGLGRHRG